jgi:hypothetical protein
MRIRKLLLSCCALLGAAWAADWPAPVEVRHEDNLCVSYQARMDGDYLVVRATLGNGWHTFAMDNQKRAEEKLAGKPALSMDRNTEITSTGGLEIAGPWLESAPKDFSRPALRWFSFGFDHEGLFAAKAKGSGKVRLRGQACTETICKNVDVTIGVAASKGSVSGVDLKSLVPVR